MTLYFAGHSFENYKPMHGWWECSLCGAGFLSPPEAGTGTFIPPCPGVKP